MSGLILLFFICAWGFASYYLARLIVVPIKSPNVRVAVNIFLVGLLFLAPVADDIVGGIQFRFLCQQKSLFVVSEDKLYGRTIYLEDIADKEMNQFLIPIKAQTWSYRDISTRESIIRWIDYHAEGGWLSHAIGFPEGNPPYTFNGSCRVRDGHDFNFEKFNTNKEKRK